MKTRNDGFSLLELLVSLSIIVILTMISYPLYRQYLVSAKRKKATITLIQLSSHLEQYHAANGTYHGARKYLNLSYFNRNKNYRFIIQRATTNHYLLQAIPQSNQAKADKLCGKLGVNEVGKFFLSGKGTVRQCWL